MNADVDKIEQWLTLILAGCEGLFHVCGTGDWTGRRFPVGNHDGAIDYIMTRDRRREAGTYLRVTTLSPDAPSDRGKRAGAAYSASLPGLWADIDIAGPGHKHTPNYPGMPGYDQNKVTIWPLPPDAEQARSIVEEAGCPKPTLWVESGGGLYPWWLLDQPEQLAGDPGAISVSTKLSEGWQRHLVAAAARLRLDYGNVGDLARVMRMPGTVNRKRPDLERPCRIIEYDGPRYSFDNLVSCLVDMDRVAEERTPEPALLPVQVSSWSPAQRPASPAVFNAASPLDVFEASSTWEQILAPHGWAVSHISGGTTYWLRPGKRRGEGHAATTGHSADGRDRMYVFSTACGLPVQEPMTKAFVWGQLNGVRDMKEVAKVLVTQGYGTPKSAVPQGFATDLAALTVREDPAPDRPAADAPQAQSPPPQQLPAGGLPAAPAWHTAPIRPGEGRRLPEFPVGCLPPVMADLVRYISASKQVDPTMPALFALATVSAVAASKAKVFRSGDWYEALSLYTCAVAESGERKSPAGRPVFGAVSRIEKQMAVLHASEVDSKIDELDKQRAEVRGNPAASNRLEDKITQIEASRRRPPRIKIADDITPEAMVRLLSTLGGHGAILDPEGTFMGTICGRYSNGSPNPELLIKAYDGDEYTSDRISRDPERIERPTLAVGVAVQQVVLDDVMTSRVLLERGALARFIYGFPQSRVGSRWEANSAPYDPGPGRAWTIAIEGVAELPVPASPDAVPSIALSPQALDMHRRFTDHIESRLAPGGDLSSPGLKEWSHKHAGRVLRIAALLHLVAGFTPTTELNDTAMTSAICIGEWAIEHARWAHLVDRESIEEATVKQCNQVIDWMVRSNREHFTVREACRGIRAQWVSTKAMGDALDQLAELGWVRETPYQDKVGRWRVRFAVSPHATATASRATM